LIEFYTFNKRGISAIVASVLLILFAVFAVFLLWFFMSDILGELSVLDIGVTVQPGDTMSFYDEGLNFVLFNIKRTDIEANISYM
jgi:flagellin-like protein